MDIRGTLLIVLWVYVLLKTISFTNNDECRLGNILGKTSRKSSKNVGNLFNHKYTALIQIEIFDLPTLLDEFHKNDYKRTL